MNIFDEKEFEKMCASHNWEAKTKDIVIRYYKNNYFKKINKAVEKDRRGEVVFCVIRPNGKIITITCKEYPEGVFRIPTGGIGFKEDIVSAVYRETKEELGLNVEICKFAGVLKIRFEYGLNYVNFYSYMFILRETAGMLLEDATDDEVSEVREASIKDLLGIAESLSAIKGKWSDWGKFRYETSKAIYEYLNEYKTELKLI